MSDTDLTKTTTQKTKKMSDTDLTKNTTQKTKKMGDTDLTKKTPQKTNLVFCGVFLVRSVLLIFSVFCVVF
jgi:hypothetical protein